MNRRIKIGIGSYTYTWAIGVPGYEATVTMSPYDLIHKAIELNAEIVQYADNMPMDIYTDEELYKLFEYAQDKSIGLEVGARGLTRERLERYISIARILHSSILRFVIDDPEFLPTKEEVIAIITSCTPLLSLANIHLALENHDRFTCDEFVGIIRACNSPRVGICLDTVNSLGVPEGTEVVMSKLLPYTVNLHIKDFQIERSQHKMGFVVSGTSAGNGKLDIVKLFNEIIPIGRCKSAILELWTPFEGTMSETIRKENQWAIESMNYLNQLNI